MTYCLEEGMRFKLVILIKFTENKNVSFWTCIAPKNILASQLVVKFLLICQRILSWPVSHVPLSCHIQLQFWDLSCFSRSKKCFEYFSSVHLVHDLNILISSFNIQVSSRSSPPHFNPLSIDHWHLSFHLENTAV